MNQGVDRQINLLCIGDVLSGKSYFLEQYTKSKPEQSLYKIYPYIHQSKTMVFLHEVGEREGMDAYLSYPYDAVLYFLNILDFHNPRSSILEQLSQISRLNGSNIFKIPLKIVVLSSKELPYFSITLQNKKQLIDQLSGLVHSDSLLFVEKQGGKYEELDQFYRDILMDKGLGIQEGVFVNWWLKGVVGMGPWDQLRIHWKKVSELVKRQWLKLHNKYKPN